MDAATLLSSLQAALALDPSEADLEVQPLLLVDRQRLAQAEPPLQPAQLQDVDLEPLFAVDCVRWSTSAQVRSCICRASEP